MPLEGLDETLRVTAVVSNTREVAGDEIARLYVCDLVGEATRPVKELKGFQKVSLAPGDSKRVAFKVPVQELGFYSLDIIYKVEPRDFQVWIGPDSSQGQEYKFTV
jgi:beta-glucosidase